MRYISYFMVEVYYPGAGGVPNVSLRYRRPMLHTMTMHDFADPVLTFTLWYILCVGMFYLSVGFMWSVFLYICHRVKDILEA